MNTMMPPSKKSKPTPTTKSHRYESFTKRVSRLKIDPVHIVENNKIDNQATSLSHSFFRESLDQWAELNLTQTFTTFSNKVNPLSENLPQLLHHADTIFDLLVQHIEKQDALALEPLLSLLAHLAHDLGQKYEKYFARTVQVVAKVAVSHADPDIIEWCFTCLAWMFKYLSRLLVHDMRPLLEIMIPFLSAKKDYLVRFSAESLAFLLRKAASLHRKNKPSLSIAVKYLLDQVAETQTTGLTQLRLGIMTLFVETCAGLEGQLHTSADSLVDCLLATSDLFLQDQAVQSITIGVLVALTHQTNATSFQPVFKTTLAHLRRQSKPSDRIHCAWTLTLLHVLVGTRSGTRILDWTDIIDLVLSNVTIASEQFGSDDQLQRLILQVTAEVIQNAPMDQLLPWTKKILDLLTSSSRPVSFFAFCTICAELGEERFRSLVLPRLQQFIISRWSLEQHSLFYTLERLNAQVSSSDAAVSNKVINCPSGLQDAVLDHLEALKALDTPQPLEDLAGHLHLVETTRFSQDTKSRSRLLGSLHNILSIALANHAPDTERKRRIILGWGLQSYVTALNEEEKEKYNLLPQLLTTTSAYLRSPLFLSQCNRLLKQSPLSKDQKDQPQLLNVRHCLMQNLLMSSVPLKVESLEMICEVSANEAESSAATLMLDITTTPYTPSEARKLSMLLRRLPKQHSTLLPFPSLRDMIPSFCLGLLGTFHDALRKDVCEALAIMAEDSSTEEFVLNIALQWLQTLNVPQVAETHHESPTSRPTQFECTKLNLVENVVMKISSEYVDPRKSFAAMIDDAHQLVSSTLPQNARALGLQILNSIPASVERRSRLLVPIFLAAPMNRAQLQQTHNSDTSTSSHTMSPEVDDHEWSLPDRRQFVSLFAKFNNPRVLFRSSEVLEKITELLGNGNADIRKSALQAVLKWKDPVLMAYEDVLLDIAEDKKTPADLGVLLSLDEDQSPIMPDHRANVLPVALRLIFGSLVGRVGSTGSQEARRKSILRNLFRMSDSEIGSFLDITLARLKDVHLSDSTDEETFLNQLSVPEDQQYGFLRLLLTILESMKSKFSGFGQKVIDAVVLCVANSSLNSEVFQNSSVTTSALPRSIRRTGVQCLVLLSDHCPEIDWPPYIALLFKKLISPRIESFASETSQGISGLLRLFAAWARSPRLVGHLRGQDSRLPNALWQCLTTPSAQKDVKLFILEDIVLPWISLAADLYPGQPDAMDQVQAEANALFSALTSLIEQTPPRDILNAIISILPSMTAFPLSTEAKEKMITLLQVLLESPAYKFPPQMKSKLLLGITSLLRTDETLAKGPSHESLWCLASAMFNYFKDDVNRQILCEMLQTLSQGRESLAQVVQLCYDMNSVSSQRLGEYDYEKRLSAFNLISTMPVEGSQGIFWLPIVCNLLFFIRGVDDFSIRSNGLSCLRTIIIKGCASGHDDLKKVIRSTVLPAVRKGAKEDSEHVRADFVSLFGLLIQHLSDDPDLADMVVLLVGNDEEASFFSNVLHIQQHRRVRAIRRLIAEVEKGHISPKNIAEFFIPLLEKFVYDSTGDESLQGVKGQSIAAMGVLLQWTDWKQFRALFRRYRSDLANPGEAQKNSVKLLGHAADALLSASMTSTTAPQSEDSRIPSLAMSISSKATLENELRVHFIPKLAELIHYKDETEISFRIPIAVTNVKLIKMLPAAEVTLAAAPVVLDIANILRSRTQESRDVARNALAQIVVLLGPSSVQFVIKELRTALTRGYQLHVLSFTVHTILVELTPAVEFGSLDYCVEDLLSVVIDDTFGVTGQEKENQDYISSMKEVKKNKSYDSMELLARSTSVSALSRLVTPLQTILSGSLTTKQVRQVDELLRRLGLGVSQNPGAKDRDLLVFAYQLIQSFYTQKAVIPARTMTVDEMNRQRFLLQPTDPSKTAGPRTSPLLFKLAKFALDLVRSTLQKHDELCTSENVHGFLPIIGDALIEAQEDVKISALRLLSAIMRLKMPELDQNAPLYLVEAVKMVKNSTNTNEEAAQAALKLISSLLRERKTIPSREVDIATILHRIAPDIEEPDRQGVTFNFIRAVMSRKMQSAQLYDLVDKIGMMMVTNHARSARDVARGVYVHFLLEYPQSSTRWAKQQKFLLKNLDYQHPEGRQSVMEAMNTLVLKLKGDAGEELASSLFLPILLRMANDDNKGCRELAGVLLRQLFRLADMKHLNEFLEPMQAWIEQDQNVELQKISMQAYGILLDSEVKVGGSNMTHLRDNISRLLHVQVIDEDEDWELQFHALLLLSKLAKAHPELVLQQKQTKLWSPVWSLLSHSNSWIQSTTAELVQTFFQDCGETAQQTIPLICSHGLRLNSVEFLTVLKRSVRVLRRLEGNQELGMQTIQNLLFMAKCLDTNGLTMEVIDRVDIGAIDESDGESTDEELPRKTKTIKAIQYLLDQIARILRVEMSSLTSGALHPKLSALQLFTTALPSLSRESAHQDAIRAILLPLQHVTDTNTIAPRSGDPTFSNKYKEFVELAQNAMEEVQGKIGDAEYVQLLTDVSKIMRLRREERRSKRRIERVAEPERAAMAKRRKGDRKKERKREIGRSHQRRRREV
ncbi:hypothetical protein B0A52_02486 [Exophiala mesophila]|uniref:Uncharacterized protein n=1 Tax=Exophiala mesophila TaxID=212818 RepID=A0A438NCU5_EXOME|nr:hypothetical protein B0A52_02486 [Exophiala mesophila]